MGLRWAVVLLKIFQKPEWEEIMRLLCLLRGVPGSGKTSFIREMGLEAYALSSDAFRNQLGNPTLTEDGRMNVNQSMTRKAFTLLKTRVEERLMRGETTVVDFTGKDPSNEFYRLGRKCGAYVFTVDFSNADYAGQRAVLLEKAVRQNAPRAGTPSFVPESVIASFMDWMLKTPTKGDVLKIPPSYDHNDPEARAEIKAQLAQYLAGGHLVGGSPELVDFTPAPGSSDASHPVSEEGAESPAGEGACHDENPTSETPTYEKVVFIGDIHGEINTLKAAFPEGLSDKNFYVFVGDYIDRGTDSAAVLTWLWDNCFVEGRGKRNVVLLRGNHETHLYKWMVNGRLPQGSKEFGQNTVPNLKAQGWTPENRNFRSFVRQLRPYFAYQANGAVVLASHGGLPALPPPVGDDLTNVSPTQLVEGMWQLSAFEVEHGWGGYETLIDRIFTDNANRQGLDIYQVHGHRNLQRFPIIAAPRSFNLEGRVEFGGHLRVLEHDLRKQVFTGLEYADPTLNVDIPIPAEIVPSWDAGDTSYRAETLEWMVRNRDIQAKKQKSLSHVTSLNFKKEVLFDKKWDGEVNKARGIFVDTESHQVVARSYNKFFNIGERPDTLDRNLQTSFAYPVALREKLNGFLGISGYDEKTDSLVLASKSTLEGEFARLFQRIARSISTGFLQKLTAYNKECGASCIFEVIDPVNDPHIVDYATPQLVLLDVVRRSENFERLPYAQLLKVAAFLEVPVAKEVGHLNDARAFSTWLRNAQKDFSDTTEGYVLSDAKGEMVKFKTPYYAFWRKMREAIKRERTGKAADTEKLFSSMKHIPYGEGETGETRRALIEATLKAARKDPSEERVNILKVRARVLGA